MRTVRSYRELKLKQKLVGRGTDPVIGPLVLCAHLTEFARPVGHDEASAGVHERRIARHTGTVQAPADKPAPCHLVVAREIRAPRRLCPVELFAPAPDPLGAPGERV